MKIYETQFLGEDCNICGINDDSPVKIARAIISKILDNETFHYHPQGHEFYYFYKGAVRMRVQDTYIYPREGQLVHIEPREPHKIEEILEPVDYIVFNTNPDPKDKVVLEE